MATKSSKFEMSTGIQTCASTAKRGINRGYIMVYLLTYHIVIIISWYVCTSCHFLLMGHPGTPQSSQETRPSARVSSAETQLQHIAWQEIGPKISKFLGGTSWVWSVVSGHVFIYVIWDVWSVQFCTILYIANIYIYIGVQWCTV